jgi:hypothetical protein
MHSKQEDQEEPLHTSILLANLVAVLLEGRDNSPTSERRKIMEGLHFPFDQSLHDWYMKRQG